MDLKFPRPAADIVVSSNNVVFYKYKMAAKYGDNWGLSNLTYVNPEFRSVEVQYHMKKIPYCTKKGNIPLTPEQIKHYQKLIYDTVAGPASKSAGTKTQFKRWKIELNTEQWNKVKDSLLKELVDTREKIDPWFAKQLKYVKDNKLTLVHPVARGVSYEVQAAIEIEKNKKLNK